jgi:hypothetical protein
MARVANREAIKTNAPVAVRRPIFSGGPLPGSLFILKVSSGLNADLSIAQIN